jgi:allophanate hydrolase subunit 2
MAIDVVKPGFATSVQDLGRPGYYHLGIPLSGAMDRYALRAANLLVGNDEGDAGLEAVFMGRSPAPSCRRDWTASGGRPGRPSR